MNPRLRKGAMAMGLFAAILGLFGCGRPSSQVVFAAGGNPWQILQADSPSGPLRVAAMGDMLGEGADALAKRAAEILRRNFSDPWLKFEADPARPAGEYRLVYLYEARAVRHPDFAAVCQGRAPRFERDAKTANIYAVLCGPNGPIVAVHGWMDRPASPDDPALARLVSQMGRQAMQGST
jgi:hypothetical protein